VVPVFIIIYYYFREGLHTIHHFSAQGKCQTKTLSFKVIRNKGDDDGCEKWVFEYLDVPVACECYLSKSSWLEAMPPPAT